MISESNWEYLWSIRDLADAYSYICYGCEDDDFKTLDDIEHYCEENHIDYTNVQRLACLICGA